MLNVDLEEPTGKHKIQKNVSYAYNFNVKSYLYNIPNRLRNYNNFSIE